MIFKKIILLTLFIYCTKILFGQNGNVKNRFNLIGKIFGQDSGILHLQYTDENGKYISDSAKVVNGKFTFTGLINTPVSADIYGNIKSRRTSDFNTTNVFLEPTTIKIVLTVNDFKHATITGSRSQTEIETINRENYFQNEMDSLVKKWIVIYDSSRADKANKVLQDKANALREQLEPYYKLIRQKEIRFISMHPDSYVSAYLLQILVSRLTLDSAKLFFNNFTEAIKNCNYGKEIEKNIRSIEGGSPGTVAKNFTTNDINGNLINLYAFREKKYILLDFWATWCVPCRQNNPHLIELYNTYSEKGLEIIGIANDDTRIEEWKKAIVKDKIGVWKHVLQGVGSINDIGQKFGITPIPAKILIDKNGVILLRYEGDYDFLLDKKLSEIFNHE